MAVLVRYEFFGIQHSIRIEAVRIDAVFFYEAGEKSVFRTRATEKFVFSLGLFAGLAQNNDETRNDADSGWIAAEGDGTIPYFFAEGLPGRPGENVAIDDLAMTSGKVDAAFRRACLGDDRMALRPTGYAERTFDVEEGSLGEVLLAKSRHSSLEIVMQMHYYLLKRRR